MVKAVKKAKKKRPKLYKFRYFLINIKIRRVDTKKDIKAAEYSRLFKEFYQSFTVAKSSAQKDCLLMTQGERSIDGESILFGEIVQVTNINNKKWFDKEARQPDPKFSIPGKYGANAATAEYAFIPSIHRFSYQHISKDYIDPYGVKKYFKKALELFLSTGYYVDVDVESDISTIERIFSAAGVSRIFMQINYSNNDFSKALQEFVEEDMRASNTGELTINAAQKPNKPIDLSKSEILTGALLSSKSNGEVDATIVDADGKKKRLKTKDMPLKMVVESTKEEKINTLVNKVKNEFRQK